MKDTVQDILDTLEEYRSRGRPEYEVLSGKRVAVLDSPDGDPSKTLRIPRTSFHQPSRDFERDYNLSGIAGDYKMPPGLSEENLQMYCITLQYARHVGDIDREEESLKLRAVYETLSAFNPVLAKFDFDRSDPGMMSDVIQGVAGSYHPRDIQGYIRDSSLSRLDDPKYMELYDSVMKYTAGIEWIADIETLRDINKQFVSRGEQPAPHNPWKNAPNFNS